MGIPSPKPKPWYVRATWPAVVALVVALPAGCFSIAKEAWAVTPSPLALAATSATALSAVLLAVLKIFQAAYQDEAEELRDSPDNLRGPLHVIHRTIARHKKVIDPAEGWLRLTVHRVDGDELEQAVAYVGSDDEKNGRSAGRRFSIKAGLIGRVARVKETRTFDRGPASFEDWDDYLVEQTGMDRSEAEKTRPDRRSFLGIPIAGPDFAVRAVLYLDSGEEQFFTDKTVDLAVAGCDGLAKWIDEHYYRK